MGTHRSARGAVGHARYTFLLLLVVAVVLTACASGDLSVADPPPRGGLFPDLYDPTQADEERPDDYRESLPRDAINPVYNPTFVDSSGVDWPEDELVIGIEIDGEARAYPVGFLTWREIVNDTQRGIPTMVTW